MNIYPPFQHIEQRKHVQSSLHENFGKPELTAGQTTRPADAMTSFCSSLEFKWKIGHLRTWAPPIRAAFGFKEPVFLLRSESKVTLYIDDLILFYFLGLLIRSTPIDQLKSLIAIKESITV